MLRRVVCTGAPTAAVTSSMRRGSVGAVGARCDGRHFVQTPARWCSTTGTKTNTNDGPAAASPNMDANENSASTTPTTSTNSSSSSTGGVGFRSTVRFSLAPEKVTAANCPSHAEVAALLPSVDELKAQLPTTAQVKHMYQLNRPGAGRAPPLPAYLQQQQHASSPTTGGDGSSASRDGPTTAATTTTTVGSGGGFGLFAVVRRVRNFFAFFSDDTQLKHALSTAAAATAAQQQHELLQQQQQAAAGITAPPAGDAPLWPDSDTPEDILNEERFGGEGEEAPSPSGEHLVLAWKALLYGTGIALACTAACFVAGARYFGFSTWAEVVEHLRSREEREMARLRAAAVAAKGGNGSGADEVLRYELDLTQPSSLFEQATTIWEALQQLAEEEAAAEEAEKALLGGGGDGGDDGQSARDKKEKADDRERRVNELFAVAEPVVLAEAKAPARVYRI